MAFTGLTPESLLERSDSKNPATTCKGITKLGRPCRNPLRIDAAKAAQYNGVLAMVSVASDSDDEDIGVAAFFCYKHKDQAQRLVAANTNTPTPQLDTRIYPLQNRSSIDTLVARLGVLEVNENSQGAKKKTRERQPGDKRSKHRPPRKVNRPPTWDRVQGPLMEVPSDLMKQGRTQGRPERKKPSFWESLCCGTADEDYVEVVRHKKKRVSRAPPRGQITQDTCAQPARIHQASIAKPTGDVSARKPLGEKPAKPANMASPQPASETASVLSYIPKSLTPQMTSMLLAELSKPISPHDDEGYIYIFWLTPESAGPAPSSTASTLLVPPSRPEQGRRTSDVLRQYSVRKPQAPRLSRPPSRSAVTEGGNEEKNTILLKIGRANNVHRRMNEWTRQCGYSLSLVRFYPYVPSTPSPSPRSTPRASPAQSRRQSAQNVNSNQNPRPSGEVRRASSGVRKVPHAHRVERLIHIELMEQRATKQCDACGAQHREWFEVDATKDGVKNVDKVVKRWVSWAERAGNA